MKSNQKNIGTIKSSNLCTEIIEYSDENEYACCTLASIGLPMYITPFDSESIGDINVYSIDGCKTCVYAKKLLDAYKIEYSSIKVVDDDETEELSKCGIISESDFSKIVEGEHTFPVILVDIGTEGVSCFTELYKRFSPKFD